MFIDDFNYLSQNLKFGEEKKANDFFCDNPTTTQLKPHHT